RRIDRDDPDGFAPGPKGPNQAIDEGTLSDARRACEPDDVGAPRMRVDSPKGVHSLRLIVFDQRNEFSRGALVPLKERRDEVPHRVASPRRLARRRLTLPCPPS